MATNNDSTFSTSGRSDLKQKLPALVIGALRKILVAIYAPLLCLPPVPLALFNSSIIASFFLTFQFALLSDLVWTPLRNGLRSPLLDALTFQWFLDPLLWHILIAMLCSMLILWKSRIVVGMEWWSKVAATALPFIILGLIWMIGDRVIKPTFAVSRPPDPLPEPMLTGLFRELAPTVLGPSGSDSMPSGFVMRQIALFYIASWLLVSLRLGKRLRITLMGVNVLGLFIVCFARIYRGAHSFLDIAVAISVGTMAFWIVFLLPFYLVKRYGRNIYAVHVSNLAVNLIILFAPVLGFSKNAGSLLLLFMLVLFLLAVLYRVEGFINLPHLQLKEGWPRRHWVGAHPL